MQSRQSVGVLDVGSAIASPTDRTAVPLKVPALDAWDSRTLRGTAAGIGKFILHFLEMVIAMGIGMAIFGPVKVALADRGYSALLDRGSLDYQVWMNLFMIAPMVLWMRVRGCSWRHGAEMGGAMIIPTACVLLLCRLGISDVLPWFTTSLTRVAMFVGMLAVMLYRREMYTTGYSVGWIRRRRAAV